MRREKDGQMYFMIRYFETYGEKRYLLPRIKAVSHTFIPENRRCGTLKMGITIKVMITGSR